MSEHPGLEFAPNSAFPNLTLDARSSVIYNLYDYNPNCLKRVTSALFLWQRLSFLKNTSNLSDLLGPALCNIISGSLLTKEFPNLIKYFIRH